MSQFKIYGHASFLSANSACLSDAIHAASVSALGLPEEKRFHRFLPLEPWQLIAPSDRSEKYIIIEVMMFAGRPIETKKAFYSVLLTNLGTMCGVEEGNIELVITESPRYDWLIRGLPGDELTLNYQVDHRVDSDE